jgi:hypothetical protein
MVNARIARSDTLTSFFMVVTLPSRHLNIRNVLRRVRTGEKSSESGTGEIVDSLERFHQSRAVVEDFSSKSLSAIPTFYGRLSYVSSLRNPDSGCYEHDGLTSLYPEDSVQEGLTQCHEELFSRVLETPLREQELDLGKCLGGAGKEYSELVESLRDDRSYQNMCPDGLPEYLHDFFCSNMKVLLTVISSRKAN